MLIAALVWLCLPLFDAEFFTLVSVSGFIQSQLAYELEARTVIALVILSYAFIGYWCVAKLEKLTKDLFYFRDIVTSHGDLLALIDKDLTYVACNQAYLDAFNLTYEDVINKHLKEVLGQEHFQKIALPHANLALAGETVSFEGWYETVSGQRYYAVKYYPKYNELNTISGYVAHISDITAEKDAQDKLKLYESLAKHTTDCMYWVKPDGAFFFVNDSMCQSLGYSSEELLSMTIFGIKPHLNAQQWQERFAKLRQEKVVTSNVVHVGKNGQEREIQSIASYVKLHDLELSCSIGRDVSESRELEKALRIRDKAFDTLDLGTIITDARAKDNPIIFTNPAIQNITGYSAEELLGVNCRIFQGTDTEQKEIEQISQALKEQRECHVVLRNYRKNGDMFWNDLRIVPVKDESGITTHFFSTQHDITQERLAENALTDSQRRLQLAIRSGRMGLWEYDIHRQQLFWDNAVYDIFEIKKGMFKNENEAFKRCLPPGDAKQMSKEFFDAIQRSEEFSSEFRIITPEGKLKTLLAFSTKIFDQQRKLDKIIGIIQDVSLSRNLEHDLYRTRDLLRKTQSISRVGGWELNLLTNELSWTDVTYMIHELPKDFMPSVETALDFYDEESRPIMERAVHYLRENGKPFDLELKVITAKNNLIWVRSVGEAVRLNNKIISIAGTFENITERKLKDIELQKLSRAVESSSASIIITDDDGNIEYVNPAFEEHYGYSAQDVRGQNIDLLKSDDTPDQIYSQLRGSIKRNKEWKGKLKHKNKDGSSQWDRVTISLIRDKQGKIINYVSIQEDITKEHQLNKKLSYQASHDALTGLINRTEFEKRAQALLASENIVTEEHVLCFLDLDQFKVINDTSGHAAGDEMLKQIAEVLKQEVRMRDTLARLGGDEFAVLMEHCTLDNAQRVAHSIKQVIQDFQFSWEGHVFRVGVSIGVVPINNVTCSVGDLMKQADAACYMAKDLGRNRIHIYSVQDKKLVEKHGEVQWVERIHRALDENRFCIYAHSIVSLDEQNKTSYELLIRLKNEDGSITPPGGFLPAAERYYQAGQIDRWVIEHAFKILGQHQHFFNHTDHFSINLSGQSIADETLLAFIIRQLEMNHLNGQHICFEITETAAIANLNQAKKFITLLQERNVQFALDDFGSGLSSFGYLKSLPVNYLKIDGMFVKDIVDDSIDYAMVKSINDVAQVMGMKTIAEFVENDVIRDMLVELGVNYAQGYGIGKPLPLEALLAGDT